MPVLYRDFETRSTVNLVVVGTHVYASHHSTEILCIAHAVDNSEVKLWLPGMPVPPEFFEAANNPDRIVVAHNDAFERAIEEHVLAPRYGWPLVPLDRHRCTMASAHARALPGDLQLLAEALQLENQTDKEGTRIMQRLCKPRRARKDEDPTGIYWDDDPTKLARLYEYCKQDVRVEREVYQRIGSLPESEQKVWLLDAIINKRGLYLDATLLDNAIDFAVEIKATIPKQIAQATDGAVVSINQFTQLSRWLCEHGCDVPNVQKDTLEAALGREGLTPSVRQVIRLRLAGAQAATSKLPKMRACRGDDGRIRGQQKYHGAHTGRFSSTGVQAHNFKKAKTADLQAAIDAVCTGNLQEFLRRYPNALAVLGDIGRAVIAAAPGHQMLAGDFSSIESRVLAWLAGEQWKIDTYHNYDETGDIKYELYCLMASQALGRNVTPEDEAGRHVGKTYELSFSFGGGLGAWRKFDDSDTYSDAQVEDFKRTYRQNHPATKQFWYGLDRAAQYCVLTRKPHKFNRLSFEMDGSTLLLALPSGRQLSYPETHIGPGKFEGTRELKHKSNANGQWVERGAWYGKLTENVVQATARDIMVAAMLRLEKAGYPVVLTVHDEIVCEVPDGFGSPDEFHRILTMVPEWAKGLPIAAKARNGKRFAKIKRPLAA
jgi:DNA polymerase